MSNMDKLAQAGVDIKAISNEEKEVVESLSPEEVDTLVNVKAKLDNAFKGKAPSTALKIV